MAPHITSIETYILKVPLKRPIADSIYYRTHWHVPVVGIRTDDYYALGTRRGSIKERWFSSVVAAMNGELAPADKGMSYIVPVMTLMISSSRVRYTPMTS